MRSLSSVEWLSGANPAARAVASEGMKGATHVTSRPAMPVFSKVRRDIRRRHTDSKASIWLWLDIVCSAWSPCASWYQSSCIHLSLVDLVPYPFAMGGGERTSGRVRQPELR